MSLVMYPDLRNRRDFIHDCFLIALGTSNDELKMVLSRDPYFYVNREDVLLLLKNNDIKMIKHLLISHHKFHITTDIDYRLVAIKREQVDKNQMTVVTFLDFMSVMIENKRVVKYQEDAALLFTYKQIL